MNGNEASKEERLKLIGRKARVVRYEFGVNDRIEVGKITHWIDELQEYLVTFNDGYICSYDQKDITLQ